MHIIFFKAFQKRQHSDAKYLIFKTLVTQFYHRKICLSGLAMGIIREHFLGGANAL
jgi:hypothetical protein